MGCRLRLGRVDTCLLVLWNACVMGVHAGKMHSLDCNLGLLLIGYFRFYGRQLDYSMVGVSCNDGGYCYVKNRTFPQQARWRKTMSRGDRFSIMDPLDSSNDVAGCARSSSRRPAEAPLHGAACRAPPSPCPPAALAALRPCLCHCVCVAYTCAGVRHRPCMASVLSACREVCREVCRKARLVQSEDQLGHRGGAAFRRHLRRAPLHMQRLRLSLAARLSPTNTRVRVFHHVNMAQIWPRPMHILVVWIG